MFRVAIIYLQSINVDYTKCVKNSLEQQHALNSRIAENEEQVIFSHRDFLGQQNKLSKKLEAIWKRTRLILKLSKLKFFEDEEMRKSNVSFETSVAGAKQAASSISGGYGYFSHIRCRFK